jgi:sialate O-acetylesterase
MKVTWLLPLLLVGAGAFANVRLPAVLSDNMILQQHSTARLWGWCEPGEKIYVTPSWKSEVDSVRGTRDGNWQLPLSTPAAGGPYTIQIWTGSAARPGSAGRPGNTIVLKNVLIGEVWVLSGQSNMEMCETWGLPDVQEELPTCYNSQIHFFHVPRTTSVNPQDDVKAQWTECDSNTLKSFSAAGYFFAKRLNGELHVPVGLIEAAWGGTPAEVWTPAGLVNGDSTLKAEADKQQPHDGWPYLPGYCYNGMIAPLTSFSIAGALWYQGEANVSVPNSYAQLLETMIGSWRKAWNSNFPFYYVQIAPFTYGGKNQAALLREQEGAVQTFGNTGMVVISDLVSDTTNIHPKDKHDVGIRLANWALAATYHQPGIVYKNPWYLGMESKGDRIIISLADAPTGLTVKGSGVRTLYIAGDDKVWYPAEGKIEGSRLIVFSRELKKPVAVRYQFSDAGIGNLFSKEGLPVAPFRTDNW